ncbi:MAG: 16S rRNA (adenine(1518)-N(6)/adenine(1519)-N(6))-dimethyltransferase RsmA [Alphaproteobacteria bacterium]
MVLSHLPKLSDGLKQNNLWAKKSFGQHFLLDENFCYKIAALTQHVEGKYVAEVGPGPGGLSRAIISRNPKAFTMIEMDKDFAPMLIPLSDIAPSIQIHWGDALKVDIPALFPSNKITLLSNLPYNIGTVLLIGWLKDIQKFEELVLMFQKEVALRICAQKGDKHYGRLAVMTNWLCKTQLALKVPPAAFTPPPKVDSAVIIVTPRPQPLFNVSFKSMEFVVAAAFNMRRKMLKRSLKSFDIPWETLDINPTLRPEELDIEDFGKIAKYLEDTNHPSLTTKTS